MRNATHSQGRGQSERQTRAGGRDGDPVRSAGRGSAGSEESHPREDFKENKNLMRGETENRTKGNR